MTSTSKALNPASPSSASTPDAGVGISGTAPIAGPAPSSAGSRRGRHDRPVRCRHDPIVRLAGDRRGAKRRCRRPLRRRTGRTPRPSRAAHGPRGREGARHPERHGPRVAGWERRLHRGPALRGPLPTPDPDTTRGQARAIGRIANDEGWRSLIMVTSTFQLSRAGLLLGRCWDGTVVDVEAEPHLGPARWAKRIAHEWLGWAHAELLDRGC
jgi:hypothetical protein